MARLPPNRRSRRSGTPSHSTTTSTRSVQPRESVSRESPNHDNSSSRNGNSSVSPSEVIHGSASLLPSTQQTPQLARNRTMTSLPSTSASSSSNTSARSSSTLTGTPAATLSPLSLGIDDQIRLHRPSNTGIRRQQDLVPMRQRLHYTNDIDNDENSNPVQVHANTDLTQKLNSFMAQQILFNEQLMNAVQDKGHDDGQANVERKKVRLPKVVTAAVRDTYRSLQDQNGQSLTWDLSKSFVADENQVVNHAIIYGVRSTEKETPAKIIKAAMHVYFRTKKREHTLKAQKLDKVVQKAQRTRSRKNTKRLLRKRVLHESTSITEENKAKYAEIMVADYMSSEHSASDGAVDDEYLSGSDIEQAPAQVKTFSVGKLQWRSAEANKVMALLDSKVARKRGARGSGMVCKRIRGALSSRPVPFDAPAWALNSQ